MIKNLWVIAVLLVASGVVAHADNFTFSYTSNTGSINSLVVNGSLTASPNGNHVFTVDSVSGTYNGVTITDIAGPNGTFTYLGTLSFGSFDFLVKNQLEILFFGPGGFYIEDSVGNKIYTGTNFTITDPLSTSEAGTLSLLSGMGLGAFALARKLLLKTA